MALSVQQMKTGPVWPLGFVPVAANGTPVCIMNNVDANNNNAPWKNQGTPGNATGSEYTTRCVGIAFQGYKPGANNNGMVQNAGNIYIVVGGANGAYGNRADSGAMIKVLFPGADYTLNASDFGQTQFSPYSIFLDCDNNNDGALVVLLGPQAQ